MFRTSIEGKCLHGNNALSQTLDFDSVNEMINTLNELANQIWLNSSDRSNFAEAF